ncbi:MAG: HEAT repeat domain-containing protein [Armatimonadota bacterium]
MLVNSLTNADPLKRAAAVEEIGKRNLKGDMGALKPLLGDPLFFVRVATAGALLKFGDESGVPVLHSALTKATPTVALRAAGILASRGDPAGITHAQTQLGNASWDLRASALTALLSAPDRTVGSRALTIAITDRSRYVRGGAVLGLARRGDQESIGLLKGLLRSDPDQTVRVLAARGIADTGMSDAIPLLIECLSSSEEILRTTAMIRLDSFTGANPTGMPLDGALKATSQDASAGAVADAWTAWWTVNKAKFPMGQQIPGARRNTENMVTKM